MIHKMKDGQEIPISDMTTDHIRNTINLIKSKGGIGEETLEFYLNCPRPRGDMAEYYFDQELDNVLNAPISEELDFLEDELKRRELTHPGICLRCIMIEKCEFYPPDDCPVCDCGSEIGEPNGKIICTKEYSLSCQYAVERRKAMANMKKFKIAGVKFHQYKTVLNDIVEGDSLMIAPEPTNKFDPNAVQLLYDNGSKQAMLGYVPKTMSSEVSAMIEVGKRLDCTITKFNKTASPWDMFEVEIKEIEDE